MKSVPIKKLITANISGEWGTEVVDNGGVAVIRTANFLNSGKIDFSKIIRREIDKNKVSKKKLFPGDIIIEKSGGSPSQPVGRVVLFKNPDGDTYLCNNFTSVLRPKRDVVYPEYLFYVLYNNHKKGKTLRYQNKTTGIINLKLDNYLQSEIPLPPLDDQIRIAHLLGKVEGLITQRKENLQQLDELLKSVFLEMFGDYIHSKNETNLGSYITTLTDYHANGSYETLRNHVELLTEPNFALMVRTTDLENNNFSVGCNFITEDAYNFLEKSKVFGGEIIVNKIGSAGKVYLMPVLNRPVSLGMNAFLIRFDEGLDSVFAYYFLTSKIGTQRIQKLVKGAVTKTITKDAIRSISIPLVHIDLQNRFTAIAVKVEALKFDCMKSLTDLENLYGALSQKAFKGELDLSRVPLELLTIRDDNLPEVGGTNIETPIETSDKSTISSPERRIHFLKQCFTNWLAISSSGNLSFSDFLQEVRLDSIRLWGEDDFIAELTLAEYDLFKEWLFEAIDTGRVEQTRNTIEVDGNPDFGNQIVLKRRDCGN